VNRFDFLLGVASVPLAPRQARGSSIPQNDKADPAVQAQSQALRVLLGAGEAQRVDDASFFFDGRRYRGSFSQTQSGEIVNTLSLEQYLYSVVSREMPSTWPASALQTQAIVARTYVLQRSDPTREYDLVPSEADQVYTGVDAEHPQSSAAVDATSGQVLRFSGGFAQVMYSSCCGGHTESNAGAWGGNELAYLTGVKCAYCSDSPWYKWTRDITLDDLQRALAQQVGTLGRLTGITLDRPDASGRPLFWTFYGNAQAQRVKAEDVRRALGTRVLPSLLVRSVALQPDERVHIEGGGLGHGVGLCQWGARGMALAGADPRAILAYYYPGTVIGDD
jgi:stage II sporulation protein D